LDRACVERGWFIERSDGRESVRVKGKKRAGKPRKVTISGLEEAFSQRKEKKVI